jgi:hypothetical protein
MTDEIDGAKGSAGTCRDALMLIAAIGGGS